MTKVLKFFREMTTTRKTFFVLFFMISALWAYIIFGFSSNNATESLEQSNVITELVVKLFEPNFEQLPEWEQEYVFSKYVVIVRKTAHFVAFALLGFLTYFCVGSVKYLPQGLFVQATISLPFCALFAVSDEIHQTFVDGRSGRLLDVGIDTVGAFVGTAFAIVLSAVLKSYIKNRKH